MPRVCVCLALLLAQRYLVPSRRVLILNADNMSHHKLLLFYLPTAMCHVPCVCFSFIYSLNMGWRTRQIYSLFGRWRSVFHSEVQLLLSLEGWTAISINQFKSFNDNKVRQIDQINTDVEMESAISNAIATDRGIWIIIIIIADSPFKWWK